MEPGIKFRLLLAWLVLTMNLSYASATVSGYLNYSFINVLQTGESVTFQAQDSGKNAPPIPAKLAPAAIGLIVTQYESRLAQISWTTTSPGIPGTYHIERKAGTGNYIEIAALPYTAPRVYNDTISFPYCTPTQFTYHVTFVSGSGLDDASSGTSTITLSDINKPADLLNVNVSLMQTSSGFNPRLSWDRITNDSISGYLIQRYNGFSWDVLGTTSADSGFYTHTIPDACSASYKYVVRSKDKCNNESDQKLYKDINVQTIYLQTSEPNECDKTIKLTWNAYKSIPGGIGGYKITRMEGAKCEIFNVPATDTTYTDSFGLKIGQTYLYSVTEMSANGITESASCQAVHAFNAFSIPDVYITQVSVEQDKFIRVSYQITPPSNVVKLYLQRSDNGTSGFSVIDSISVNTGTVPLVSFVDDLTADVHARSYYYRYVAITKCGDEVPSSNVSRSILLQCTSLDSQNETQWNSYETWMQGVQNYTLFRSINGEPVAGEILTTSPSATSFTDPLTGVDSRNLVCYWVTANENLTTAISKSNTCCVLKEPDIYMPNAFHPGSVANYAFRPVNDTAFADPLSFSLTIFNRWGQQLCETTDMIRGWDGTSNGQESPAGLYTYLLTYKSKAGKSYTKRGTVFLVR
mgnify:CR=1 FL=1